MKQANRQIKQKVNNSMLHLSAQSCSLNLSSDISSTAIQSPVCVHNNPTVTTVCLRRSRWTFVVIQRFLRVSHSLPQSLRNVLSLRWDLHTTFSSEGKVGTQAHRNI